MARSPLPEFVRFLIAHAALGFIIAGVFTAGLIGFNFGGIGTLLAQAPEWPVPTLLLWFLLGLTTSSFQMGAAIMLLGEPPNRNDHGRGLERAIDWLRLPITGTSASGTR